MRIILGRFQEELVAVRQMVLARRCFRRERRLDAFGVCQFQSAVHLVGRYVVEALAFIFLGQ